MASAEIKQIIRSLSDRLIEAQGPIRILDAIKWDDSVQQAFFKSGCNEQPVVDQNYYRNIPLGFEPDTQRELFADLLKDTEKQLGVHPAGLLIERMCREYSRVIEMLEARGTPEFSLISAELYGTAQSRFHSGSETLTDLGRLLDKALVTIDEQMFFDKEPKIYPTPEAVSYLQDALKGVFNDPAAQVHVIESDGIVADAAAGSDYIKLKKDTMFSKRDLDLLAVHEGWVHVGTTLNGQLQPVCTFLSKGTPSDTNTQEGLAVFIEIISFTSHPARLRRIVDRIHAIQMVEQGATFVDVYKALVNQGRSQQEAYTITMRVFRGSTPTQGAFAKDLVYARGFIQVYNFIRLAVKQGKLNRIPLLFCGKLAIEDMPNIIQLHSEGLIESPRYLPPVITDLKALTTWMAFSNFLNRLDLNKIESEYHHLLK